MQLCAEYAKMTAPFCHQLRASKLDCYCPRYTTSSMSTSSMQSLVRVLGSNASQEIKCLAQTSWKPMHMPSSKTTTLHGCMILSPRPGKHTMSRIWLDRQASLTFWQGWWRTQGRGGRWRTNLLWRPGWGGNCSTKRWQWFWIPFGTQWTSHRGWIQGGTTSKMQKGQERMFWPVSLLSRTWVPTTRWNPYWWVTPVTQVTPAPQVTVAQSWQRSIQGKSASLWGNWRHTWESVQGKTKTATRVGCRKGKHSW